MKSLFLASCFVLALSLIQVQANDLSNHYINKIVLDCTPTTTYTYVDSEIKHGTIITRWAWMHTNSKCKTSFGYLEIVGAGNPFDEKNETKVEWKNPEIIDALGGNRGLVEDMLISKTQAQDFSSFTTDF